MANNLNTPWARLTQKEKAELIGIYTRYGYNDLADIIYSYNEFANGGEIHIKESKKGTFTAAAKSRGMGVQEFASKVLANKDNYSAAMVKKANFARNAAKWHDDGGPLRQNGNINASIKTEYLPDISTPAGKTLAKKMAYNVLSRNMEIQNVPRKYYSYVNGEIRGAQPTRDAINNEGVRTALTALAIPGAAIGASEIIPVLASSASSAATWLSNPTNQMTIGKFALPMMTGMTIDEGVRQTTPYHSVGEAVLGTLGLDEAMDYAQMDPWLRTLVGFGAEGLNPGYYTGGLYEGAAKELAGRAFKTGRVAPAVVESTSPAKMIEPVRTEPAPVINEIMPEVSSGAAVVPAQKVVQAAAPYEISDLGGGYMLKSLMRGNPLEKQIGKNGTVNVNNVRSLVGKGSNVEKAVVDKVLASEEFAGKKSIDYNKFRKAVQDELITYERMPDTRYEDYGLNRIGYDKDNIQAYRARQRMIDEYARSHDDIEIMWGRENPGLSLDDGDFEFIPEAEIIERLKARDPGWFNGKQIPVDHDGGFPSNIDTYTFSSPRILQGSDKHYNYNTLGHSRTYTTADEPYVLHVMESQSDWAQQGVALDRSKKIAKHEERYPGGFEARRNKAIGNAKKYVDTWKKMLETGVSEDGRKLEKWDIETIRTDLLYNAERKLRELEAAYSYVDPQELYLSDNFTSRQIQENLRYAAEKGQTKMRYPTRETAAKIEGYPEREAYFDASGKDVTVSGSDVDIWSYGEEIDKELSKLNQQYEKLEAALHDINNGNPLPGLDIDNSHRRLSEQMYEIRAKKHELISGKEPVLKSGFTKKTVYDHEDILRKYTEFPKQYKKLYKNADVRTVTDPKGNTWYEVDVPKDYLKQEWVFKNGGPIINTYATGGPLDLLRRAFAKNYKTDTFSESFAAARSDDRDYFKWNGNRYNTKLGTESFLRAIRNAYNSYADGGPIYTSTAEVPPTIVTPDKDYNVFLNSLPDNQKYTPEEDYSTKRYWELHDKPKDFEEAKKLGMYTYDSSDNSYHANSVAWGKDGIGYFMKPKHHDTLKYELDWYNRGLITEEGGKQHKVKGKDKKEWRNFRDNYILDTSGDFYRYLPKKQ